MPPERDGCDALDNHPLSLLHLKMEMEFHFQEEGGGYELYRTDWQAS